MTLAATGRFKTSFPLELERIPPTHPSGIDGASPEVGGPDPSALSFLTQLNDQVLLQTGHTTQQTLHPDPAGDCSSLKQAQRNLRLCQSRRSPHRAVEAEPKAGRSQSHAPAKAHCLSSWTEGQGRWAGRAPGVHRAPGSRLRPRPEEEAASARQPCVLTLQDCRAGRGRAHEGEASQDSRQAGSTGPGLQRLQADSSAL